MVLETKTVNPRAVPRVKVEQQMKMVLSSFTPGVFSGLTRNHRYRKILESEKELVSKKDSQEVGRKRRVIPDLPRQNLLETMNVLIAPGLFFGLETRS